MPNLKWLYKDGVVSDLQPSQAIHGFIYELELADGTKYIGKKAFWSTTKKKFGKKRIAEITDKRLKHYEMVIKESNWRGYLGSSKTIIKESIISKRILLLCRSKKELSYMETKLMFQFDVLGSKQYCNDNINGTYFREEVEKWNQ